MTLSGCKVLKELPEGFGNLIQLTALDLSDCERLERLSSDIGNLQVSTLTLKGCKLLKAVGEILVNWIN
ncbi:MAG: hypothetical protein V8R91_06660 [Butyricimonas faecihominis]